MNAINDDDDLLLEVDTDDEDLALDIIRDKTTKESFMSLIGGASKGDLLRIIELLPNSSQRYGHSLTMNAVMKIISRHATCKDRCTSFYTMKKKRG